MPPEKSIASVIADTKEELKTFVQTRVQLLRAETKSKLKAWKFSLAMIATGALLLVTSWFAFIFAFIALLHSWLGGDNYTWCFGGLIAGALLLILGLGFTISGIQSIKNTGVAPTRTLHVLKQDQEWIQNQSRSA